jgi:hypothetical protein
MVSQKFVILNERPVHGKQTQDKPKIDEYPSQLSRFIDGGRFQATDLPCCHIPVSACRSQAARQDAQDA